MKKITLVTALLSLAFFPGCKKSSQVAPATSAVSSMNTVKVPGGFNWESSHTVNFSVAITDARFGNARHAITIYDGDPNAGGHILSKGSATTTTPFTSNIYISNSLAQVYVVKTAPDNSKIISATTVAGITSAALSFGATDPTVEHRQAHRSGNKTTSDCSSGCTSTITSSTNNVNVNNGNMICITGSNITVNFSGINGGTIRVCGSNVTLQNVNLSGSAELWITSSGSANVSSLNFNSSSATFQNDGTFACSGSFADGGIFTNNGTFSCSGDFNLNSSCGAFNNNGTMTVGGSFNNGSHVTATNAGHVTVAGNFQQNGGSASFVNDCSLLVSGNYNQSAQVQNYSFIKVSGTSTINSSTELGLYNGAMLETNGFILDASVVKGYGSTSLVKITGSVNIRNSGAVLNGALQVYSTNSVSSSYLTGGAATGSNLYIATSACNADGNGTASVPDTDGDGVPDNLDDYPNDATKAYNNYYPSSTGSGTVAFEDEWPSKGDFDMNDMVVGYQYKIVTNASNVVVQVTGNYTLVATGGEYSNGFAVQLPVASGNVSGMTGGTLESGQTNAVVILFYNMRNEMAQWNTRPGVTKSATKSYSFTCNVTSGPTLSTFGLSSYNPFIWSDRTREVHLPGHHPTDLANTAVFGTYDDNTSASANRYYVTTTGLPYAIDIPGTFSYPTEGTDITQAYLHFAAWAQSGGTSFVDWYSNTANGYRNNSDIYTN